MLILVYFLCFFLFCISTWAAEITFDRRSSVQDQLESLVERLSSEESLLLNFSQAYTTDDDLEYLARSEIHNIQAVDLGGQSITDRSLGYLAQFPLTFLNLKGTSITGEESLENPNLLHLNLSKTCIGDEFIRSVKLCDHLVSLNLGVTRITNEAVRRISHLVDLEYLNLEHTAITDEALEYLAGLGKLKELNLSHTQITSEGLKWLAPLTQLKTLRLAGVSLSKGFAPLSSLGLESLDLSASGVNLEDHSFLKSMPWKTLDLSDNPVTDVSNLSPSLTDLNLSSTQIDHLSVKKLATLKNLRTLNLSHTAISDASWLKMLKQLEVLHLEGTPIVSEPPSSKSFLFFSCIQSREGGFSMLRSLPIETLNVSGTSFEDHDVLHLNRSIQELNLSRSRIRNEAIFYLKGFHLRSLNLQGTSISDQVMLFLKETQLQYLNLSGTQITDEDFRHLRNVPLKVFDVSYTRVGNEGLCVLRDHSFHELYLAGTRITDEVLPHVLARSEELKIFDLSQTAITDRGLRYLLGCVALRDLRVGHTAVSNEGCRTLAYLRDLESLELENTQVNEEGLKELVDLLYLKYPHVKTMLRIRYQARKDYVRDQLEWLPATITDLDLSYCILLPQDWPVILSFPLKSLGLDATNVENEDVLRLQKLVTLESLSLIKTRISSLLGLPSGLTSLDASFTQVNQDAIEALRGLPLKHLRLVGTKVDSRAVVSALPCVEPRDLSLREEWGGVGDLLFPQEAGRTSRELLPVRKQKHLSSFHQDGRAYYSSDLECLDLSYLPFDASLFEDLKRFEKLKKIKWKNVTFENDQGPVPFLEHLKSDFEKQFWKNFLSEYSAFDDLFVEDGSEISVASLFDYAVFVRLRNVNRSCDSFDFDEEPLPRVKALAIETSTPCEPSPQLSREAIQSLVFDYRGPNQGMSWMFFSKFRHLQVLKVLTPNEEFLAYVKPLEALRYLALGGFAISSDGMKLLGELSWLRGICFLNENIMEQSAFFQDLSFLRSLEFQAPFVKKKDFARLQGLSELEYLNGSFPEIKNEHIRYLRGLPKLRYLVLKETKENSLQEEEFDRLIQKPLCNIRSLRGVFLRTTYSGSWEGDSRFLYLFETRGKVRRYAFCLPSVLEECPETDLFWRRSLARVLGIEEDVLDLSHDFLNDPYRDS